MSTFDEAKIVLLLTKQEIVEQIHVFVLLR